MKRNTPPVNGAAHTADLHWPGRVVAVEDLRRNLNGHRRLIVSPAAVVTPLAAEQLRDRGVEIARQDAGEQTANSVSWGCGQDRAYAMVLSALQALARERIPLRSLPDCGEMACRWARAVGECIAAGECCGGVVFCQDPGLVCCVANKLPGLRAVPVTTVAQAARATLNLGANLLAVEMPGRTFFEVRQILRQLCSSGACACPDGVACTLQELDGHAHR